MAGERIRARISRGFHGDPEWVHDPARDESWQVVKVVETRYLLVVTGQLPELPGHTGQFLLDAVQDDRGRWLISPADNRYPAGFRGAVSRPGER